MDQNSQTSAVTMKEVADKAGVSTATVSRALMNPEKVSAATRQKVEQAALAVGYVPRSFTRNVRHNETRIVMVMVPDICDPFFSEIIRGIEVTATQKGYLVLIGDCAHQPQKEKEFLELLLTRQVDGLILLGSQFPFALLSDEQRYQLPVVMANEFASEMSLPTVHIDNLTAAFVAVNHLLKLGHQRIACIAGPDSMPLCRYRTQGYIQALRRSNLPVDPACIIRGDFSFATGAQALTQLMSLPQPPQALFCHSDVLALGAMSQANRLGLRVPEDVSIVGFDDIEMARYCDPPLTTIAQPRYQIGCEATQMLLEAFQGKQVNSGSRLLESELVIRGSTASAKQRAN